MPQSHDSSEHAGDRSSPTNGSDEVELAAQAQRAIARGPVLQRLHIGNVKSLAGEHVVPLAPLTLIYGPNAAGKSTIIQSLLLLAQSVLADHFEPQGRLVNVRDFRQVISGHDPSEDLTLGLDVNIEVEPPAQVFGAREGTRFRPGVRMTNGLKLTFHEEEARLPPRTRTSMWIEGGPTLTQPVDEVSVEPEREEDGQVITDGPYFLRWRMDLSDASLIDTLIRAVDSLHHLRKHPNREVELLRFVGGLIDSGLAFSAALERWVEAGDEDWKEGFHAPTRLILVVEPNASASLDRTLRLSSQEQLYTSDADDAQQMLERWANGDWQPGRFDDMTETRGILARLEDEARELFASGLSVLGPTRPAPRRVYLEEEALDSTTVAVARRLHAQEGLLTDLNEWLRRLEIPYSIEVDRIVGAGSGIESGYSLDLTDVRTGVTMSLADVGYGVSQVLPIVTECLGATERIICVEQPELHLHPRLQSSLGELFVESVRRGNQVIAETHSENILLRIRNLVRQGRLDAEDVAIVYVDNSHEEGVTVRRLRLGPHGELLDPWPTGFFDDRLRDILGVTE